MNINGNKYSTIEKIGEGSFGTIYKGINNRTQEYVAIKVEPIANNIKLLKNESNIYQYLKECTSIPKIKWFGRDTINYYMVIDLLGNSLTLLKHKYTIFPLKLILQIGINIILLLKQIHEKLLIHRDIKPDNFLFGLNNKSNQLFLIDFGLCKTYIKNNVHIISCKTNNLIGTPTFASINAHNCLELSRRDDLESLGYMLIYFYVNELSWKFTTDNNDIISKKINIINDKNIPEILIKYIMHVRNLTFEETPNYMYLVNMFTEQIK